MLNGSNWDRKTAGRKSCETYTVWMSWMFLQRRDYIAQFIDGLSLYFKTTSDSFEYHKKKTPGNFREDPDVPVFQTLSDVLLYWNLPSTQDNWTTNVQL